MEKKLTLLIFLFTVVVSGMKAQSNETTSKITAGGGIFSDGYVTSIFSIGELMIISNLDPSQNHSGNAATSVESKSNHSGINKFMIYPNPSAGLINVSVSLKQDGKTNASVYNLLGEKVFNVETDETKSAGEHSETIDLSRLHNGIYLLELTFIGANGEISKTIERINIVK